MSKTIPIEAVAELALLLTGETVRLRNEHDDYARTLHDLTARLTACPFEAHDSCWRYAARDAVMAALREAEAERKRRVAEAERARLFVPRVAEGEILPYNDDRLESSVAMSVAMMSRGTEDQVTLREVVAHMLHCRPNAWEACVSSTCHTHRYDSVMRPETVYTVTWPGGQSRCRVVPLVKLT